jgi:hypothetical protein
VPVNTSDASNTSYRRLGNARSLSSQCLEASYYLRCGVASGIRPGWSPSCTGDRGAWNGVTLNEIVIVSFSTLDVMLIITFRKEM